MGDPSSLRFVPASHSATPIDWTRVPEAAKRFFAGYGYDWDTPLPATIGDLANMFDETKFFGYLASDLLVSLIDISEFGLQPTGRSIAQAGPRFYMEYVGQLWFLHFEPGTRKCVAGFRYINRNYHDDRDPTEEEEMAQVAEETAMAQAFDIALEQEAPREMEEWAELTKKLGGQWTAIMLHSPNHVSFGYYQ